MHDDYPGQEKVLLWATRLSMLLLIGVVIGAAITEHVADVQAFVLAGFCAYALYLLREF